MKEKLNYRLSLKGTEAEEILDLIIYRPISFQFVRLIYNTNITPNQISYVALLFGVLAGVFYAFGSELSFIMAAVSFFICNVLDCADGQLARLKKNGTRIGRIIDGLIDYITAISTFVGIAIALQTSTSMFYEWGYKSLMIESATYAWTLTAIAALSRAMQNMLFDKYRNMYLKYVYNKSDDANEDLAGYKRELEALKRLKGRYAAKILMNLYYNYTFAQNKMSMQVDYTVTPEEYKKYNKFLLRMWSWIGSTTHLTLAIIFTLIFRVELYLYITIIAGNFIMLLLLIIQNIVLNKLKRG
ncbi:MAG: CDP-alcohol phosphatidyltransferase family protein [Ignavibacteria bacterium]|nr:CDP-alcohol phosphatidyltransferase family protein [Ignavibacteria bacterium]